MHRKVKNRSSQILSLRKKETEHYTFILCKESKNHNYCFVYNLQVFFVLTVLSVLRISFDWSPCDSLLSAPGVLQPCLKLVKRSEMSQKPTIQIEITEGYVYLHLFPVVRTTSLRRGTVEPAVHETQTDCLLLYSRHRPVDALHTDCCSTRITHFRSHVLSPGSQL